MKILFVNSVYGVGSTGKIVQDLCKDLNNEGHQVRVCYGRKSKVIDKNSRQICSKMEFYLDVFLSRLTGLHGCFSLIATRRLITEIEEFNPDIVHLHNIHGYYLNIYIIVNYLKKCNIKVVWTLHDELMFTGKCSYAYDCDKWLNECGHCPQIKEYPKSLFWDFSRCQLRWKRKCFSGIQNFCFVTPSKWLANRVKKSLLKDADCKVINNGIDTEQIFCVRDANNLKKKLGLVNKKIILTVTDDVYSNRKGIDTFIEIADRSRESDLMFVIVGGMRKDLQRENVLFVPSIKNQEELSEFYSMADVFVITSKCDNFPTVCLESLACGTPVVGFEVGGIAETAPNKNIGLFVQLNNLDDMIEAIKQFICSKKIYVEKCRKYAVIHYSKLNMIESYKKLYTSIIKEGK